MNVALNVQKLTFVWSFASLLVSCCDCMPHLNDSGAVCAKRHSTVGDCPLLVALCTAQRAAARASKALKARKASLVEHVAAAEQDLSIAQYSARV